MQHGGLVRGFDNLKDYRPASPQCLHMKHSGKAAFAFTARAKKTRTLPRPLLARGNAALYHQTRLEHTLDGACRRLFDLAKHHVNGMLGKHGHVLLD